MCRDRRGLAASRDLKEGEMILFVPEFCLLSVESAKEDEIFMEALHHYPQLSSVQVFLMHRFLDLFVFLLSYYYDFCFLWNTPRYIEAYYVKMLIENIPSFKVSRFDF